VQDSSGLRRAVVCVAAGKSQIIVIRKVKELGLAALAVDRNSHAPGFRLADERIVLSTYEPKPIIARLRSLQGTYRIVGLVNRSSGPPVVTSAEICQSLGLPGVPPDSARLIVDKSQLLATCAAQGIPVPTCQSAWSLDQISGPRLQYPCVIKPALSLVGKSGVRVVRDAAALPDAFAAAHRVGMNGLVNIEEFLPGHDVSLMAVVQERRLYPITLLDELNATDTTGDVCGVGFAVPSVFSGQPEEARIIGLAQQVVDIFELGTTALNMSCRCEVGGQPRLVEIHLDLGGDLILDALMPASTSFDVLGFVIRALMGEQVTVPQIAFGPAAVLFGAGEGLVSERAYDLVTAVDRAALEHILSSRLNEKHVKGPLFGLQ